MSSYPEYQTELGLVCSPIIFFDPSGEMPRGRMHCVAQQIDIMPTILGMLGYQKPYLAFGKDVLNATADDTWAVNYMNGIYQYVKHNHVLQFDGKKTRAVYALSDSLMQHNKVGQFQQQQQMEQEVKAIIQQYMERMTQDRLMPNRPSHK